VKLLLDTHIWLWSLAEPARLGRRLRHQLRDRSNQLWLSPVSSWEALLLNTKGRIRLHGDLSEWRALRDRSVRRVISGGAVEPNADTRHQQAPPRSSWLPLLVPSRGAVMSQFRRCYS
jgi:PIN domain nuclease of toxin-antitoxin system